jgi:hypothetical protein
MLESYYLNKLEELIVDALDLGIYDTKNYKIERDITYVSIKYGELSMAGAFRNKKCVVMKLSLIENNVKIPVFGGKESNPASREWITNDKKLRKKTLGIINGIISEINMIKHHHGHLVQTAV